jgi:hypothetical protein
MRKGGKHPDTNNLGQLLADFNGRNGKISAHANILANASESQ